MWNFLRLLGGWIIAPVLIACCLFIADTICMYLGLVLASTISREEAEPIRYAIDSLVMLCGATFYYGWFNSLLERAELSMVRRIGCVVVALFLSSLVAWKADDVMFNWIIYLE